MKASDLAKACELSKDTLRYYERLGIITPPKRAANGYRQYGTQHIRELKFIKFAQSAGFELAKIKEAIPFLENPNPSCPRLKQALNEQLTAINNKIAELENAKLTITKWMSHTND
jgi:MerR family copper efflux transcriptional regulator